MSITFTIYPIGGLVCYTVEGRVTSARAREFLDAVSADPRFLRGFDFLGEYRGSDDDMTAAAEAVTVNGTDMFEACRWAIVIPSAAALGLVHQWARSLKQGVKVNPFLTRTQAISWLG